MKNFTSDSYVLGFLSYLGDGKYCTGNPIVIKPQGMPEFIFDYISRQVEDFCVEVGQDCLVLDKGLFFGPFKNAVDNMPAESMWRFVAGAFDKENDAVRVNHEKKEVFIFRSKNSMLESAIARLCDVHFSVESLVFKFSGSNYIDFICKMSESAHDLTYASRQFNTNLVIKFAKCHDDAVIPYKKRPSDSGYDVVVIEKLKETDLGVQYWRTGIKCEMPAGWYMDMVPRSSLSKKGFTITNCVGIIDQSYKGEIVVVVHKTSNHKGEISPGDRIAQLIPRETTHFKTIVVEESELIQTERQEKGFGSSGTK